MKKIRIKTALDDGIYASDGGGETRTHYEWTLGPRGLMEAISLLSDHRERMVSSYGSIGHSGSWIEVAGVRVSYWDIAEYHHETDRDAYRPVSRTEWCRRYIQGVRSGDLLIERTAAAAREKLARDSYDMGLAAGLDGRPMPAGDFDEYELARGYRDGMVEDRRAV